MLDLPKASFYYEPATESEYNLKLMRLLDEQYLQTPFYGSRRMTAWLHQVGYAVNRKRVQRLMGLMGLEAVFPKKQTSLANPKHRIYPYLLGQVTLERPNQIWSTDITYVPMNKGFMYLVAIIDWFSRYVVAWEISNTMDVHFCIEALHKAFQQGTPEIFNSDQGSQFTSYAFTQCLERRAIQISMDGRGRAFDNIFIERLWRSVKYEDIYLKDYQNGATLTQGLKNYFLFYNEQRPHQSLDYKTPAEIYFN